MPDRPRSVTILIADDDAANRMILRRPNDFVTKPYDRAELLARVRACLRIQADRPPAERA